MGKKRIVYYEKELIDHSGGTNEPPLIFEEAKNCKEQKLSLTNKMGKKEEKEIEDLLKESEKITLEILSLL